MRRVCGKSVWGGLGRDFQQNSVIISKRLYECTNISAQNNVLRQATNQTLVFQADNQN